MDTEATTLPKIPARFAVMDLRTMLQPRPPMAWAVSGLIPSTGLTIFFGDSGTKKTWSVLQLAACLACGIPWLGMRTTPGAVLILDEESGIERLSRRITSVLGAFNLDSDSETLPPIVASCSNGIDLAKKGDEGAIYQLIADNGAKYVIIDSLSRVMTGDENSKEDTQPVMSCLARLSHHTETSIIVIHHSNKVGGYRGSTAIRATCDTFIKTESADDSPLVTFTAEKIRDGETRKFAGMAKWEDDLDIFTLTEADPQAAQSKAADSKVIAALTEHSQATRRQLAEYTGYTENTIGKTITRLKEARVITRINQQCGRGVEAVFTLNGMATMGA